MLRDTARSRAIAGRADHATTHTKIDFAAIARAEALGEFPAGMRHISKRPLSKSHLPPIIPGIQRHARHDQLSRPKHGVLGGVAGLGDNNTVVPPDTDGAIGPGNVMIALNSQIEIQTRSGTPLSTVSLLDFWSSLGVGTVTDPRVIYDPYGQHWVLVTVGDPETTASAILVAVSNNSDPTAGWDLYRVVVDPAGQMWGDFPTLGFNRSWIVVGVNVFTIQGSFYEFQNLYAFDKANLYAGGSGLYTLLQDDTGGFSMNPAQTYDPNLAALYLLESWSSANGLLRMSTITGPVGSEVLTTAVALPAGPQAWQAVEPTVNFAPQLGSTRNIDTDDDRLDWTVYRNGSLWTAQTIFLPATGTPNRSSIQWWQIDTSSNDLGGIQQMGRIDDPSAATFFAYPSIGVNKENDAMVGYSRFSASAYASAGFSMRMAADSPGTMRAGSVFKAGQAPYFKDFGTGDNRWGDFSSTGVDPLDDLSLWTLQEYAATGNDWGTWWDEVTPGNSTPTPTSSPTPTPSSSPTPTPTPTPTVSPTPSPTPTRTPTPIPTLTPTVTPSPTPTSNPTPTPTPTPGPTPTPTPVPTASPSPTPTPVPTATPTPVLTISTATLPAAKVGVFYFASIGLEGGTPPYLAYISAGALPHGLALNTFNGSITGVPGFAGISNLTVHATDARQESATRAFHIAVSP